jgi:hypothetical protein
MRAAAAAAVLLAVAAAAGTAATGAPAAPARPTPDAATRRAVLLAQGTTPFRVRGSRFRPGERVRVTVTPTGGRGVVRRVTASRRGTFVLGFPGVHVCAGVAGKAVGSAGSRAAFSLSAIMC